MNDQASEPKPARPPRSEQRPASTEITELAPNVLRSELPVDLPGLGHVNCYILEDSEGIAVVDPGLPGDAAWSALVDRLKRAGHKTTDVHTVIVTHSHYDHYGGADRLREESGARIVAHTSLSHWKSRPDVHDEAEFLDIDTVGDGPTAESESPWGRRTPWGTWSEPPPEVIEHWKELGIGDTMFTAPKIDAGLVESDTIMLGGRPWVAVHTPGHTADHLCLFDAEEGLMITGDHVLPTITPHISGFADEDAPLKSFLTSLRHMHDFADVRLALPAHGDPFTDLYGRADHICDHHLERLDQMREASDELDNGSVDMFMKKLFKERSWGDMAASETYAHLDHLRDAGELHADWIDGLLYFRKAGV